MIGAIIIFFTIYLSIKNRSLPYLTIYGVLIVTSILIYITHDIEAAFQISSKPSDTHLYYAAFVSPIEEVGSYLFFEYPLFLRILCWPINNVYLSYLVQSVLIFILLDQLIKNKSNLILFITFHAMIFTSTNLFKDNFIIIVALAAILALRNTKNGLLQVLIVAFSFYLMGWVRPFLQYLIPLSPAILFANVKSRKAKNTIMAISFSGLTLVIAAMWNVIMYVMLYWSKDASVQDEKSSPPVALIKIFLGPAPRHYLHHDKYFNQPLLDMQGVWFYILHIFYYFVFSFIAIYIVKNYKKIFNLYTITVDRFYAFIISMFMLLVYVVAYGSADIRQRAVILVFFFIFVLADAPSIFVRKFTPLNIFIYLGTVGVLAVMTLFV